MGVRATGPEKIIGTADWFVKLYCITDTTFVIMLVLVRFIKLCH